MKTRLALTACGAFLALAVSAQAPAPRTLKDAKTHDDSLKILSQMVADLQHKVDCMEGKGVPPMRGERPEQGKYAEGRPEGQCPEGKGHEGKCPECKGHEGKCPEGRPEGKGHEGQCPEGRPEGKGHEGQCPEGRPEGPKAPCPREGRDNQGEQQCGKKKIRAISADEDYGKFRFGGYGEMVAAFKDYGNNRFYGSSSGNKKDGRNTISIPRFVLAFDYKFNPRWTLGAEIEFESGGVGTAYEIENSENGEYETEVEKGGEVALEQFHITYHAFPWLNVRAGHIILPIGLTNSHHEPINFFGITRPEGETTIIPSTWHENGIELFGSFGRGYASFDYQLMVTAGLNACGFDRNNWVQGGKQGIFEEDNFCSPAYVARLNYTGVPGLRVGASIYYCANTAANSDKLTEYSFKAPLRIYTFDAQYKNEYVTARVNCMWGNLTNAYRMSSINTQLSNKSPYTRVTPIAHKAVSYGAEVGLSIAGIARACGAEKCPTLYPFARYDYFNSQKEMGHALQTADKRCEVSKWTFGLNWYALSNLVVKADYSTRQIGTSKVIGKGLYNSENEFSIGLAFTGWFTKK